MCMIYLCPFFIWLFGKKTACSLIGQFIFPVIGCCNFKLVRWLVQKPVLYISCYQQDLCYYKLYSVPWILRWWQFGITAIKFCDITSFSDVTNFCHLCIKIVSTIFSTFYLLKILWNIFKKLWSQKPTLIDITLEKVFFKSVVDFHMMHSSLLFAMKHHIWKDMSTNMLIGPMEM